MFNYKFHNNKSKLFCTNLLALSVAAVASAGVSAEVSSKKGMQVLEEVIVNARRKEESLQSVPVSVTALDSEALLEASITSSTDLQQNVPGIFLAGSGGYNNPVYVIRGQSKGLLGTSSPAVVSYFAEVPQPSWGSAVPQFDMANIQVLKGPQGTLFGRNTTGGAILYSPQEPLHELSGYVSGTMGDENHRRGQGALNIPLVQDKLALRIAGDINQRDGYTKNIGVGEDLDAVDTKAIRVSLLAEFDSFRNLLTVDRFDSDNAGFNTSLTAEGFTAPLSTVVGGNGTLNAFGLTAQMLEQYALAEERGPFINEPSFASYETNERLTIVNRTDFEINDNLQIVNIFGYQSTELAYAPNIDGIPALQLNNAFIDAAVFRAPGSGLTNSADITMVKATLVDESRQISNEFQLRGSAFDDRLDWLVGAFWVKMEPDGAGQQNGTTILTATIDHNVPAPTPNPLVVGFGPSNGQYLFLTDESKAVFARGEYNLTDALSVEVGVRYTEDDFEACVGTGASTLQGGQRMVTISESQCREGDPANVKSAGVVTKNSDEITWSVGLNWQATDDVFAYAVARHGYRAGGGNGPVFSGTLMPYQSFEPETVDDFELGIRADWNLGGMGLRTNISYFSADISDAQGDIGGGVQTGSACNPANPATTPDGNCDPSDDPTGGALVLNVGDTSVEGVDIELVLAPIDNLTLGFNATFQDADVDSYIDQPNPFINAIVQRGGADPFLFFVNDTIQANIRYALPLGDVAEELVLNLNYYESGDAVKGDVKIPGYSLTNFRADLRNVMDSSIDLSLFVNNVNDEEYPIASGASTTALGVGGFIYGAPRLWGVEARYSF
ncbi:MAG: TonB-dependent receptor [Gammaproteobacteria bacterium]|uniref:TonB-dependent receptor n=1 Tax=Pseudomaricurvus alcaniphilus TaxID=1166482 RepID=UPI00140CF953|nr:TonB-dependent receptor [Pseudomaricurvus alcaniphilus]MBR9909338.1 TonB-dependent receptor [Gammaproteobacteria bacterium]NHN38274.1 TonB-dependent receptor [Pseudomaricurvus alcaniphilus]